MTTILYILFLVSCIVLIVAVLLQPGKADAGALFSSGVSSTAFGPRGTQTLLAKITIGAAAAFMLIAIMLSLPAITGQRSVLQTTSGEAQPTPQASPATSPAASPATSPAASPAQGQTNTGEATQNANAPAGTTPAASPAANANAGAPQPAPSK